MKPCTASFPFWYLSLRNLMSKEAWIDLECLARAWHTTKWFCFTVFIPWKCYSKITQTKNNCSCCALKSSNRFDHSFSLRRSDSTCSSACDQVVCKSCADNLGFAKARRNLNPFFKSRKLRSLLGVVGIHLTGTSLPKQIWKFGRIPTSWLYLARWPEKIATREMSHGGTEFWSRLFRSASPCLNMNLRYKTYIAASSNFKTTCLPIYS